MKQHELIDEVLQQITNEVMQIKEEYASTQEKVEVIKVQIPTMEKIQT